MKLVSVWAVAATVCLSALPLACGSKSPQPENPQNFAPGPDAGLLPVAPSPEAGPVMVAAPADAGAPEAATIASTIVDPASQELIRTQIKTMAAKQAPGMKPEGPFVFGNLTEGQSVEGQAMFMPGKCYTVIGTSMLGVQELDVQVAWVTILPNLAPVIAMDNMTGPQAVVAGSPNCYKVPPIVMIGTPVKIIVKATKGAGPAGAQLYAK
jgi:hypothetical protein